MCFGYFPTYALGSAFAAQFFNQLNKEIDIDKELSKGNFLSIKEWLTNNIYQYGALYKSKDLIKKVCHEEFNPKYYIDHLLTKIKK
jgi:carboxypeptidase Taq